MAIVSSPGKILWIGGYTVLERPSVSFVTGVDKRVYARVEATQDEILDIACPQFNAQWSGTLGEERGVSKQVRFVHAAATVTAHYLREKGALVNGLRVRTLSHPAFGVGTGKSGLGSSAAVTVAVVGAVMQACGKPVEENVQTIHHIAQYVHARVQGKVGSGFDVAASCVGACTYSRYSPHIIANAGNSPSASDLVNLFDSQWDYTITPLSLPPGFLAAFGNFVGGSTSTSEMVKKVREWKEREPETYRALVHEIDEANRRAVRALQDINRLAREKGQAYEATLQSNGTHPSFAAFKRAWREGRKHTKQLGERCGADIESDECTTLIEETEKMGAFVAKLPGAGGEDAIAALCLSIPEKKRVQEFWRAYSRKRIEPIALDISNEGVRGESLADWEKVERQAR